MKNRNSADRHPGPAIPRVKDGAPPAPQFLLIDDNPDDLALAARELRNAFPDCHLLETGTETELDAALAGAPCDLVITDYHLPWSDGLKIFQRIRKLWTECPVILYTGTGNEEIAVRALKAGVDDYLVKSPRRLPQLVISAKLALDRNRQRTAARHAEHRLRDLFESLPIGVLQVLPGGKFLAANPSMARMLGYADPEKLLSSGKIDIFENDESQSAFHQALIAGKGLYGYETRLRRADGSLFWSRFFAHPILENDGTLTAFEALVEDIQARKEAELGLVEQEREARRANEWLSTILETAPTAILGVDTTGTVRFVWNRAAEELLGRKRGEAIGKSLFEVVPDMVSYQAVFQERFSHPVPLPETEMPYRRPDGRRMSLRVAASPFTGPDGKPAGLIVIVKDETEQRRAEEGLRLNESRLSLIYESVSDLLMLLGVQPGPVFRVEKVNKAVSDLTRRPLDSFAGRTQAEVFPAPVAAILEEKCREVAAKREVCKFHITTRMFGDERLTAEVTLNPILDSAGACSHILAVARDETENVRGDRELHRMLHTLRESEHRYRALAEAAHDMIFIIGRDQRVAYVNSFAASMVHRPAAEIVGLPMETLFHPATAQRQSQSLDAVWSTGEPVYREALSVLPGGEMWLGTWLVPMRDDQGSVVSVLGLSRDITERVKAEQGLRENEERYRTLVDTSPDAILMLDSSGRVTFANERALTLTGSSIPADLIGKPAADLVVAEERSQTEAQLQGVLHSGKMTNITQTVRRRNGETVFVEVNASAIPASDGRSGAIICIWRDLTERRRRENALQRSEAQFRAIFESAAIGVVLLNKDLKVQECNQSMAGIMDISREKLLQKPLGELIQLDEPITEETLYKELLAGSRNLFRVEGTSRRGDGSTIWCRLTVSAVRGPGGELLYLAGMVEDISKQRDAEQASRQAADAMRRYAERLETLHEIDQAMREAHSTEEIAVEALKRISRLVPCHRSSLILFDFENRVGRILDAHTTQSTNVGRAAVLPFDEYGAALDVMQTEGLYTVEDLLREENPSPVQRRLLSEGIRSVMAIPLKMQGNLIGALHLGSGIPGRFTREHTDIAQEVADLLAVAIQQARLFDQVRRHSFELEAIATLGQDLRLALTRQDMHGIILRNAATALGCDFICLFSIDPNTNQLLVEKASEPHAYLEGIRTSLDADIFGPVITANRPYRNNRPQDLRESPFLKVLHGMRAIACVPLITRGRTIGAVWVGRNLGSPQGDITAADMRLLGSISDVIASALQRAVLFEQTDQRLQRLAALRAVDMAISASIEMRVTLSVLLDQATAQLKMDAADILLLNPTIQSLTFAAGRGFRTPFAQQTHLQLGQGYAGQAALERRVISVPHLAEKNDPFARVLQESGEHFKSYFAAPLIGKGQVKGVIELFGRAPHEPDPEWLDYLETMAAQAAIAIDNASLFEDLQRTNTDLMMAYDATIEGWSHALELRDRETQGHTQRVTDLTVRLGRTMGIREADLIHVRRGALMHDIGKMAIPDSILLKPGPLSDAEWVVMRKHPTFAYDLLSPIAYLRPALDIPYCHHEKWDGSGYPRGLKGEQIPLAARVFTVVDVWDALNSDRPYRTAWQPDKVRKYIRDESGRHFDPGIAMAFFKTLDENRSW